MFLACFQPVHSSYRKQCAVFVWTPVHILYDRQWFEKGLFHLVPFITWPIWFCFPQVGKFFMCCVVTLQDFCNCSCVCDCRQCCHFPFFLGVFISCLYKIDVWWHWITVFCLPGSGYWEHLSVYIWRGPGSAADRPHVVSFQTTPPPPTFLFLSVVKVACSKAKSNIVQPVFVYPAHSSVGHLPEDMLCFVTFFIRIWKGADLGYLKWCVAFFLVLDWFAEQLLNGVLRRWLLQPASLWGAHSQEGWHNHDNGKDGIEGQCVWGEVGAKGGLRFLQTCWCVWDPLRFICFLFSLPPFSSQTPTAH